MLRLQTPKLLKEQTALLMRQHSFVASNHSSALRSFELWADRDSTPASRNHLFEELGKLTLLTSALLFNRLYLCVIRLNDFDLWFCGYLYPIDVSGRRYRK